MNLVSIFSVFPFSRRIVPCFRSTPTRRLESSNINQIAKFWKLLNNYSNCIYEFTKKNCCASIASSIKEFTESNHWSKCIPKGMSFSLTITTKFTNWVRSCISVLYTRHDKEPNYLFKKEVIVPRLSCIRLSQIYEPRVLDSSNQLTLPLSLLLTIN